LRHRIPAGVWLQARHDAEIRKGWKGAVSTHGAGALLDIQ
jgi:hypothetical protein